MRAKEGGKSCTFTIIQPTQSDLVRSISWRHFGPIYLQNVPLWSHLQCECISSFFARVSILYLKPFVFPQLVPGAVLDESNRGSICNRGATYCKDRESNSRVEEESEQLLVLEKMTEILAYDV